MCRPVEEAHWSLVAAVARVMSNADNDIWGENVLFQFLRPHVLCD